MQQVEYTVCDPRGLHVVPMGIICTFLSSFKSRAEVHSAAGRADGKKIDEFIKLAIRRGDKFSVNFSGPDEAQAAAELKKLLTSLC
ncbi:MAG: HPr family phosphocarrier protein [Proteobacteria bacterium]|uniref:HPr family phosphocarrier protein n=1 Tax=Candidatus Avisuccinivibrio stercorigallinarum TaxID=2840704 RepID=A0A9D9DC46_9GAMM|nr:HPr family phosphocarrier protein [Candidatus Avisuccinivibrio stercorigallinarum]